MKIIKTLTILSILGSVVSANASIIGVSGQGDHLTNLATVGYTANFFDNSTTVVHGWNEKQNYTLERGLKVDIIAQGNYMNAFTSAEATLGAGRKINSHMLYFDPRESRRAEATFTFDTAIIGIIVLSGTNNATDKFFASDFLIPGLVPAGNIPSSHFNARGIEFGPEKIHWNSANVLSVDLTASNPGDQIRVITEAVPEPSSVAAIGIGLATILRRKTKRTR